MQITQEEAEALFANTLKQFEMEISRIVMPELNENQFGALVSICYNIGVTKFRCSTLLRKLNSGDFIGTAAEFPRWNKVKGKTDKGLVSRREIEKSIFLEDPKSQIDPKAD